MADEEYDEYNDGGGDGFDGYVETTVDPGIWLLLATTVFCLFVMLVLVPILVLWKMRQRSKKEASDYANVAAPLNEAKHQEEVTISTCSILNLEKETRKILGLAIPFTISALASSTFSNMCLIMVSRYVGTKAVTAYALTQVLVGLSDGILYGPISACTTLCAHAVGAGNSKLAGEYIQLAISFYMLLNIPAVLFWWYYMYEIILFLEWGDEETALLSQQFIRVYIWSYLLGAISSCLWQLLEIADHVVIGTVFSMAWGAMNVLVIGILVAVKDQATLTHVAMVYNSTALFFILLTYAVAECRGWLKPFKEGLFHSFALKNGKAIKLMLKQAVPLSFGSLLSNAEWAVLTFFASYLGPAEVAAWAILGSIWDVFYSTTSGIGDAAEIRVAHHLGENHPTMAQLSAYKSLFLGMVIASAVSLVYFSLQDDIPGWFTVDATLQAMLRELVPFVGVANLTMTFGMQCWSLIGAQGKYKLATWISFVSSWGVCMPLAAIFVYGFRIDLQGLTSAVVVGYVSTGAALSYVLLSTDWRKVARKIQERNAETASGEAAPAGERNDDVDAAEELYASLQTRSNAARAAARRNIRLLTVPSGRRSGLIVGNVYNRPGTYVLMVRQWSPLYGRVHQGDSVLAVNGEDVTSLTAHEVTAKLKRSKEEDRALAVVVPLARPEDDEDETLFDAIAEDATSKSTDGMAYLPHIS